jgi:hypothetical protein
MKPLRPAAHSRDAPSDTRSSGGKLPRRCAISPSLAPNTPRAAAADQRIDAATLSGKERKIDATRAKKTSTALATCRRARIRRAARGPPRPDDHFTEAIMFIPFAAMTLGTVLTVAAVYPVPTFDTRPTCAGAAQEISVTRTIEVCQRNEQEARDALASQWDRFPNADKQTCVETTRIGGFPSYVQVLTCLELARDARTLKLD